MDFDRLVFPPAPAFLVASLWYALLWCLCSPPFLYGLLGGGIVGYVLYDTTHVSAGGAAPVEARWPCVRKRAGRPYLAPAALVWSQWPQFADAAAPAPCCSGERPSCLGVQWTLRRVALQERLVASAPMLG